jgi:cellulose synthase/poly-beta-1,6-N-acetylglucosamine synthase-like glycosyltransferase
MDYLLLTLKAVATIALLAAAVPVLVVAAQVFTSLTGRWPPLPSTARPQRPKDRRLAVLVPAHNESQGLIPVMAALRPQLKPGDRILVVADNCNDDTAEIARRAGAEVVERFDTTQRGKGHALAFGMQALRKDPPALVIIVDADCIVTPGALETLAETCLSQGRPVQALYLMDPPPNPSVKHRVSTFAWRVKNLVRPYGSSRLGLPCQLMGTGMAFPWAVAERAQFATSHLVEDMKLGVECALEGVPPLFAPTALVTSEFPTSTEGMDSQRTRWEHGHLDMLLNFGVPLLWQGLRRADRLAIAMALDLIVPPLTMLMLVTIGAGALALAVGIGTGWQPLVAGGIALPALMVTAVLAAWSRHGRDILPFGNLLQLPLYVFWKLPIYFRFLAGKQVEWIRTRRRDEP